MFNLFSWLHSLETLWCYFNNIFKGHDTSKYLNDTVQAVLKHPLTEANPSLFRGMNRVFSIHCNSTFNEGMCLSGKLAETAQMVEPPSSKGKVSGSITSSVAFSHYWVKKYSAFIPVSLWKIMDEELFYRSFHLILSSFPWLEEILSLIFDVCYMHNGMKGQHL